MHSHQATMAGVLPMRESSLCKSYILARAAWITSLCSSSTVLCNGLSLPALVRDSPAYTFVEGRKGLVDMDYVTECICRLNSAPIPLMCSSRSSLRYSIMDTPYTRPRWCPSIRFSATGGARFRVVEFVQAF
jgi:hypothetical protein